MKKARIALVNIAIMLAMLVFVVLYSRHEGEAVYEQQVESFSSTVVAMEHVTENYLQGEQSICDLRAFYINGRRMTLDEAAEFIRDTHVPGNTSAHLIYADTLSGVSTQARVSDPDDYTVSYRNINLFGDMEWIAPAGTAVNITRAYTNPVNGEQSLAFCNRVTLWDAEAGCERGALILRVIPLSELENKWVFPQEEFENAEFTMIDSEGDYIIKGRSFKNNNFLEFYKSYNRVDPSGLAELKSALATGTGSFTMTDSRDRNCVLAHTPITTTGGWVLLGFVPADNLSRHTQDWVLLGVVTLGLILLFVIDLAYMRVFNKEYQRLAREAENANKAKTDFLSTMSHDIRTPMNAIMGLTTIAEKNVGDPEAVGENLRKIGLASSHLLALINDILDISKVESGKLNLSPLTFSIVDTVENLVNISQPMIKEKNISFSFRINRMEREYLYADQLRLNQIYINILSNAIKYTPAGGSVSVDMRETESETPGCVRLFYIVSDTGFGMTPEFMARRFDPFSLQTDSRVNSIQGTGLGLAITKQMVDLMNGTIDCQSEQGKGTTFTVVLDIPVADKQLDDMRLDPIDVLIADDDAVLLETAADALASLGVTADKAEDGQTALRMIRDRHESGRPYGVVILDWKMPGMDGLETVRRIRSGIDASVPILLISSYDWSDIEDAAREAGVNGFIGKPLFRSRLYEKLNEVLGTEAKTAEPEDDYSDLAGLNILVAEDNDINWEIISAMLGMFGITAERAENGRVCVDKLKAAGPGRYALVFMDIQMPVLNGLEAAREIRSLEDPWASSLPIIAMTADAFSENIAECLNAGMNGHIAKPVDIRLVIKEIRRIKEEKRS